MHLYPKHLSQEVMDTCLLIQGSHPLLSSDLTRLLGDLKQLVYELFTENMEKARARADRDLSQMEAPAVIKFVDTSTMGMYTAQELKGAKKLAAG